VRDLITQTTWLMSVDARRPSSSSNPVMTTPVITPDGRVLYTYTDLKPDQHVANTLAALNQWKAGTASQPAP